MLELLFRDGAHFDIVGKLRRSVIQCYGTRCHTLHPQFRSQSPLPIFVLLIRKMTTHRSGPESRSYRPNQKSKCQSANVRNFPHCFKRENPFIRNAIIYSTQSKTHLTIPKNRMCICMRQQVGKKNNNYERCTHPIENWRGGWNVVALLSAWRRRQVGPVVATVNEGEVG